MSNSLTSFLKLRLFVWVGGFIVVGALLVYLLAPWLVRRILVREASTWVGRPVQIESVSINPFTLSVGLSGVSVPDTDKSELLGCDRLVLNLSASSAWNGTFTFDEVRLSKGRVHVGVLSNGRLNFASLIPASRVKATPEKSAKASPSRPILIDRLVLEDCSVSYTDDSQGGHFASRLGPIHGVFENLTTKDEESGESSFSASTELGERLTWTGRVRLQPLETRGHLTLQGIRLAKYARYIDAVSTLRVPSGLVDLSFAYDASMGANGPAISVTDGRLDIRSPGVANAGAPKDLFDAYSVVLDGIRADTTQRSLSVSSVRVVAPSVALQRFSNGRLDLPATQSVAIKVNGTAAPVPSSPAWVVQVDSMKVEQGKVAFSDASTVNPVSIGLTDLALSVEGFSTKPGSLASVDLALKYQGSGDVRVRGKVGIYPLRADLEVATSGIDLPSIAPYLASFVNATLTGGAARASGHLDFLVDAEGKPKASWKGDLGLAGLDVIDPITSTKLVSLGDLAVNGLDFHLSPLVVDIRSMVLNNPSVHAIMFPNKVLNLSTIHRGPRDEVSASSETTQSSAPTIAVGTVEFRNARFSFEDRSFTPGFSLVLERVNGRVDDLSSKQLARANVELSGYLNGAPLEVRGAINPLAKSIYSDVVITCDGIEMPTFTPYSGRFVGYKVAEGKLTLNLRYRISSDELLAENHVLLDRFYLGDTVKSPEAVKLPVKLGLALLRDRSGRINVDLPIRGNLKDPDFRYGKLVWQTIGNVLIKAAASPFALLGNLVGGKEDLSMITFEPGRSVLTSSAGQCLSDLSKALRQRPDLTLEITPSPWSAADDRGLREIGLEAKLRKMKWQDLAKIGGITGDSSAVTLSQEEFARYLKIAYVEAHPPKPGVASDAAVTPAKVPEASEVQQRQLSPRNLAIWKTVMRILGIPQRKAPAAVASATPSTSLTGEATQPSKITLPKMREALLADQTISQIDRDKLLRNRENRIRDFLATEGKISPARLFIVETPSTTSAVSGTGEPTVHFNLR